jgi:hypothetical protein
LASFCIFHSPTPELPKGASECTIGFVLRFDGGDDPKWRGRRTRAIDGQSRGFVLHVENRNRSHLRFQRLSFLYGATKKSPDRGTRRAD